MKIPRLIRVNLIQSTCGYNKCTDNNWNFLWQDANILSERLPLYWDCNSLSATSPSPFWFCLSNCTVWLGWPLKPIYCVWIKMKLLHIDFQRIPESLHNILHRSLTCTDLQFIWSDLGLFEGFWQKLCINYLPIKILLSKKMEMWI